MDIIDTLKSNSDKLFKMSDWMVISSNAFDKKITKQMTIPFDSKMFTDIGIDVDLKLFCKNQDCLIDLISNKLSLEIHLDIIKSLFETKSCVAFDVRPDVISSPTRMRELLDIISDSQYKNLISSGHMLSNFQDNASYLHYHRSINLSIGLPSKLGSIDGIDMYSDPYMKYNDGRVCLFNDVYVNLQNIEFRNLSPTHDAIGIRFDYSFSVGDSKVIYGVDDEFGQERYSEYLSIQRDNKIDILLNDK